MNYKKARLLTLSLTLISAVLTNAIKPESAHAINNQEVQAKGKITPDHIEKNTFVNHPVTIERQITVEVADIISTVEQSTVPDKLDLLFLADNTDSMSPAITNVQNNASSLLQNLTTTYNDVAIGIAKYYGDPNEDIYTSKETAEIVDYKMLFTYENTKKDCTNEQGLTYTCYKYSVEHYEGDELTSWTQYLDQARYEEYGSYHANFWTGGKKETVLEKLGADKAYQLQTPIDNNLTAAKSAIDDWATSSGGNWQEGNFFALHQVATNGSEIKGHSTNHHTNWRSNAKKVIVWFGDAQSHTDTVNLNQTIEALQAQDISVIAIHTKSTALSQTQGLNGNLQASQIATETGGTFAEVFSSDLSTKIEELIEETVTKTEITSPGIDLNFTSAGDLKGLNIVYSCTDPLGCTNVKNGETRTFSMEVTPTTNGKFEFKTIEQTTGAEATNLIQTLYAD